MYVATAMSVAPVTASSSSWLLPLHSIPSPPPSVLPWITLHGHQQLNNGTRRSLSLHRPLLLPLPLAFVSGSTGGDVLEVEEIKERSQKWLWKGTYSINFFVQPPLINGDADHRRRRSPLLLVHGFGASIPHWRRNITTLAQDHTVYAVDLLGFGSSDKPAGFMYTMEAWAELLLDFLNEVVQEPAVLIGNSVGSLACVICASESSKRPRPLVRGLVLLNCSGGMNNKAIVDDWRIKLLLPLLWLIDFLLKQKAIASAIFERAKQRENLRNVLLSVYGSKESVDDTLVEIIKEPVETEGALEAFVSIVTRPLGPSPVREADARDFSINFGFVGRSRSVYPT